MTKHPYQMTLGELIKAMEKMDADLGVRFDFGGLSPSNETCSYRGYYEDLAIGFVDPESVPSVADVLKTLRGCLGQDFTGWKGGEFEMHLDSAVWIAATGRCTDTFPVAVRDDGWTVTIVTECAQ